MPAYDLLDHRIQRWIYGRWSELRAIQEAAIPVILGGQDDVIISAPTASGKTEAAFLPICSRILATEANGLSAIYVSPLKALINDQARRLEEMTEALGIPVHSWHGDVAASRKQKALRDPSGILLITPESLEAIFVNHGSKTPAFFGGIQEVVIDELHAFIGSERGRHLQSLLNRVEQAAKRRIRRVGLSATLGDMAVAMDFLRPGDGDAVKCLDAGSVGGAIRLQVKGFKHLADPPVVAQSADEEVAGDDLAIAKHLFKVLRTKNNLVFANRRQDVERFCDLLVRLAEEARVPNEFYAHHGSLSKEIRHDVEALLKEGSLPTTVVCTSTLELGIDVGIVAGTAQIGVPPSVSSLRQRLGRSGRRDSAAEMRIYVREPEIVSTTAPQDSIRSELVETIAMVNLLKSRWCEPPATGALHLSTLVHQVLALIAERGGVRAAQAWNVLCATGPFKTVAQARFASVLKSMGASDLITQASDGTLLLGQVGERLVNHYSFYAAFQSPEEYRVVHGGRPLGTLPVTHPLAEGSFVIFGGKRWRVVDVDTERKVIHLERAPGGNPPEFAGGRSALVHDEVRRVMRGLYQSVEVPTYLDQEGRALLREGRIQFAELGLIETSKIRSGRDTVWFPWCGDRSLNTLYVALSTRGLEVCIEGVALNVRETRPNELEAELRNLDNDGFPDEEALAQTVATKSTEKFHPFLAEDLQAADYASFYLNTGAARAVLKRDLCLPAQAVSTNDPVV